MSDCYRNRAAMMIQPAAESGGQIEIGLFPAGDEKELAPMKLRRAALACLGIAGACVIIAGCGGGDLPDPSVDGSPAAADAGAAGPPTEIGIPPGAPGPGSAPPAPQKLAAADAPPKTEEPAEEPAAAEPEKPANPQRNEGNSTTAEMLAMASNPSAGPAATGPAAAPGSGSPGSGMPPGMQQTMMGSPGGSRPAGLPGGGMGGPGGPGSGPPNMGPGAGGPGMSPADMSRMAQMRSQPGAPGQGGSLGAGSAALGGREGLAGRAGAASSNTPVNYHNARSTVQAFLDALRAKDRDRLYEACAQRAILEASERMKPIFEKIFDLSISDSELDELDEKLRDYKVAYENPPQSTKKIGVVLQKTATQGSLSNVVVTVRWEKKGYGVVDIGLHSVNRKGTR
jgi:hypothetical protein